MSDVAVLIVETVEEVCKHFCKFGNSGENNVCVWQQSHEGQCPFDDLLKEVES